MARGCGTIYIPNSLYRVPSPIFFSGMYYVLCVIVPIFLSFLS